MARYERVKGGEKNKKTGTPFTKPELEEICRLYIEIDGKGIHENNPKIHALAEKIERTIRSVENQLLGFRSFVTGKTGRTNYNTLIPEVWRNRDFLQEEKKENSQSQSLVRTKFPVNSKQDFKFKVSSQLKNILGKNLITDDFVAVFELVKNSFDAHATQVKLVFEKDKIIIWDNGKGMDKYDIQNKWLFVAYSAKNEGVEDIEFTSEENSSYRDRINPYRNYAGAKGIGRFSVDRLGAKLKLTTRKINDNLIWNLDFNWDEFEKDAQSEIDEISIVSNNLTPSQDFTHGVILEISELRTIWSREKIKQLKWSLEKLINPFSISNDFDIEVICKSEKFRDSTIIFDPKFTKRDIINGSIKNFIFDTLNIKTTQIKIEVSDDENFIYSELIDRGNLIYKIKEPNIYRHITGGSSIRLFYLNRSAKINFKKLMGIDSLNFGSIFLFNNGFRIFPIGEPGNDPFSINIRKSQGHSRYLGSRELIGSIQIVGDSDLFQETSSRDGGLIESPGTIELEDFFKATLRKLEKYVEPILWKIKKRTGNNDEILDGSAKEKVIDFVEKISGQDEIQLLKYSDKLVEYINDQIQPSSIPLFTKIKKIAENANDYSSLKQIEESEKKYIDEVDKRVKAEEKALEEKRKRIEAEEKAKNEKEELEYQLQLEKDKNTYLRTSSKNLSDDAKGLVHNIKHTSKNIRSNVTTLYEKVRSNSLKDKELLRRLGVIKFNSEKVLKISRLITRSNFKAQRNTQNVDIPNYIEQYLDIYSDIYEVDQIEFEFKNENVLLEKKISVLELSLVFDDLISNSIKSEATEFIVSIHNDENSKLKILISDNGIGLDKQFLANPDVIFDLGITTTDGSGIGLNSVRLALKGMKAEISFVGNNIIKKGACFQIIFY